MNWLLVVLGAMVGAPLRYLTDRAVQRRHDSVFPWGTLTVNVAGCAGAGLVAGAVAAGSVGPPIALLLGVGLCGALTTYSTFSYETMRLVEQGAKVFAVVNVLLSLSAGLAAVLLGATAGRTLWG